MFYMVCQKTATFAIVLQTMVQINIKVNESTHFNCQFFEETCKNTAAYKRYNFKQKGISKQTNKQWANIGVWEAYKFEASKGRGPKFVEHKQNCEHNEIHTLIKAAFDTTNFQKHWILLILNIHTHFDFFLLLALKVLLALPGDFLPSQLSDPTYSHALIKATFDIFNINLHFHFLCSSYLSLSKVLHASSLQ